MYRVDGCTSINVTWRCLHPPKGATAQPRGPERPTEVPPGRAEGDSVHDTGHQRLEALQRDDHGEEEGRKCVEVTSVIDHLGRFFVNH